MLSDIEIAQNAKMLKIKDIAKEPPVCFVGKLNIA